MLPSPKRLTLKALAPLLLGAFPAIVGLQTYFYLTARSALYEQALQSLAQDLDSKAAVLEREISLRPSTAATISELSPLVQYNRSESRFSVLVELPDKILVAPNHIDHAEFSSLFDFRPSKTRGTVEINVSGKDHVASFRHLNRGQWALLTVSDKRTLQVHLDSLLFSFALQVFAIIFAIGAIGAYFCKILTKPIVDLSENLRNIDKIDSIQEINVKSNDEIGLLQRSFNQLREKLLESHRERQDSHQKLIEAERLSSLGTMAAGIAHEINNPLAAVHARSRQIVTLLEKDPFDKQRALRFANDARTGCDRIAKIIRGLRAFSRDSSQDPFESTKISDIVEATLELCRTRFRHSDIPLEINMPPDPIIIKCRASQIMQVLANLLNNAYDAIKELEEKWIKISITSTETFLTISVTDSGKGIDPEIARKVMLPFYTTKKVGDGTGLGLSISKGIIEDHNGTLRLEQDQPNTTFTVALPSSKQRPTKKRAA